jgi:thiamine pyrophosphate-dependent acetolactate synthase large subunit-like protein
LTARDPASLESTIREFLAAEGPSLLHCCIDPAELPVLPHFDLAQAIRFGVAKAKELVAGDPGGR